MGHVHLLATVNKAPMNISTRRTVTDDETELCDNSGEIGIRWERGDPEEARVRRAT